ncbi:DUF4913 domain-containing protein [Antribacter gilvus]|uniref:DUF4913 domain-containing protein n=1 Tax=Antribacter gilvus TaxID=2304675 RepID=UPI001F0BB0EB|nr:DUF4913 domain-containing protein [Antribacter gilvus]
MTDDDFDPFETDLEADDVTDGADRADRDDHGEEEAEPEESPLAAAGEPGGEPVEEPAPVRRARRALRSAQAERTAAVSRVRLADERVVNAQGVIRLAEAKAADLEAEKAKAHQVRAAHEAVERAERALARLELEVSERRRELGVAEEMEREAKEALDTALAGAADEATRLAAEAAAAAAEPATDAPPELFYRNVDEFVREFLRYVYRRPVDGRYSFWSPRWWKYDEALNRLEAMWRAWEHLRLDPATGPSVWWRDHADPHMRVLLSPHGPFRRETDVVATDGEPLPYEPPPEGLFRDERATAGEATAPKLPGA